jgi:hypothetical protein
MGGLNGSGLVGKLFQFRQRRLDGVKVRQVLRRRRLFAVLHHAVLINHERRARCRVAHAREHREHDVVSLNGGFVQVAGERDADFFLFRPGFLRERAVHADTDDVRTEVFVGVETGGQVAHFLRTNAREREREEQHDGVLLAEVVAEFHVHQAGRLLGLEGEVGSF